MSESQPYSPQHTSGWLDMQLSSDSDLHGSSDHTNHGIYRSPSTSVSASSTHETETSEDGLNFGTFQIAGSLTANLENLQSSRSSVQSSWLQLELPSEESSEMRSDTGDDKILPTLWSSEKS
jgi:hypothetical protein